MLRFKPLLLRLSCRTGNEVTNKLNIIFIGRPKKSESGAQPSDALASVSGNLNSSMPLEAGARKAIKKPMMKIRDSNSFQTYIFRVMKETKPEMSIGKQAMALMNSIIVELFEKLMGEARHLMIFSKKQTLSSKEIESSIKLHFPGELQKLAVNSSRDALTKFSQNSNN